MARDRAVDRDLRCELATARSRDRDLRSLCRDGARYTFLLRLHITYIGLYMRASWFALLNYRHPEMAVQVVMRITFLLLLTTYELAEAAAPIAKPNCSDSCGDIYIPYPFGKTTECYLNY